MAEVLLFFVLGFTAGSIILLAFLLWKNPNSKLAAIEIHLDMVEKGQDRIERAIHEEVAENRNESSQSMKSFTDSILSRISELSSSQKNQLDIFSNQISELTRINEVKLDKIRETMDKELSSFQAESNSNAKQSREETSNSLKSFEDSLLSRMTDISVLQKNQFDSFSTHLTTLTQTNEGLLERLRNSVEEKLKSLQEDNSKKLEEMRSTVDEKLHATLEHRLGESFKLVCDRLELVHKGLGEMQTLASGVGDLKKVLTNVRARGVWGEIQLGTLLEQILTKDQYLENVATKKGSNQRVEFAIKLPGQRTTGGAEVLLPIDAKFPIEDYQRLADAQERFDTLAIEEAQKQLQRQIKVGARDIRDKYLDPPNTTDFGLMFLPIEGLYAEVLRTPGLCETMQREYRIVVTGPTTLAAILNSLQMGFRTLAIEKRSSEVWDLLGAIKTEFGKFGDILEKTHKKLQEATNTIDDASRKTRTIERKLRQVQEVPSQEGKSLLEKAK
ncbi:MAG: DNA recombination protein RmuC [Verrucomicrobia bacterium]|nr:DNA recombination protein RmuC [Verrucomicrobiota bacterium]